MAKKNIKTQRRTRIGGTLPLEILEQRVEWLVEHELTTKPDITAIQNQRKLKESGNETHNGRILVINDAPNITERLVQWLKKTNYQYTFVSNDDDANALLKHQRFDSILHSHEFAFL